MNELTPMKWVLVLVVMLFVTASGLVLSRPDECRGEFEETATAPAISAAACPPATGLELAALSATRYDRHVEIKWRIRDESEVLGFHVFRSTRPDGGWVLIHENILLAGANGDEEYTFADERAPRGEASWYLVEVVDLCGRGTVHGPVRATSSPPAGDVLSVAW